MQTRSKVGWIVISVILIAAYIVSHEEAHLNIARVCCPDGSAKLIFKGIWPGIQTTGPCGPDHAAMQTLNEIIGGTIAPLLVLICIMLIFIALKLDDD